MGKLLEVSFAVEGTISNHVGHAKNGPIVRALEDLGRDGPDDWAEPIAEAARLDGTISGTLMYRSQKASLAKYLTGTVTICD
jgi:hypothetical protein